MLNAGSKEAIAPARHAGAAAKASTPARASTLAKPTSTVFWADLSDDLSVEDLLDWSIIGSEESIIDEFLSSVTPQSDERSLHALGMREEFAEPTFVEPAVSVKVPHKTPPSEEPHSEEFAVSTIFTHKKLQIVEPPDVSASFTDFELRCEEPAVSAILTVKKPHLEEPDVSMRLTHDEPQFEEPNVSWMPACDEQLSGEPTGFAMPTHDRPQFEELAVSAMPTYEKQSGELDVKTSVPSGSFTPPPAYYDKSAIDAFDALASSDKAAYLAGCSRAGEVPPQLRRGRHGLCYLHERRRKWGGSRVRRFWPGGLICSCTDRCERPEGHEAKQQRARTQRRGWR